MREQKLVSEVTIVNVGYRSTNYWVVSAGRSRLLVDLGWPGMMGQMRANLRRMDVPLDEIRYALATHYHIDHAGVAQELKEAGVPLLVIDVQVAAIPAHETVDQAPGSLPGISMEGNVVISCAESRAAAGGQSASMAKSLHTPDTPTTASHCCWMMALCLQEIYGAGLREHGRPGSGGGELAIVARARRYRACIRGMVRCGHSTPTCPPEGTQ